MGDTPKNQNTYIMINFFSLLLLLITPVYCFGFRGIDIPDENPFMNPPIIVENDGVLYYDGIITSDVSPDIIKTINKNNIKILSINSMGGDVSSAIKIGEALFEKGIDVSVRTVCASACANYIFPAGKKKYVNKESFLLWHGSVHSPIDEFAIQGNEKLSKQSFSELYYFKKIKNDEINFYKKINVSYKLPICPQLQKDYHKKFPEKWFSYSPSALNEFGVKHIYYSDSASHWQMEMRKNHVIFAVYCK